MASIPELESLRDGFLARAEQQSLSNLDAANAYRDCARQVERLLPIPDAPLETPAPSGKKPTLELDTGPFDSVDALPPEANKVLQELEAMEAPRPRKRIRKPKGV